MSNTDDSANTLHDEKIPKDHFPNRRTDPNMMRRYIGGRASIACADTTQSASVTLKMYSKGLKTHSITAHPDGTMKFNGKDCTNVSHDQIVRAMIRCLRPHQPESPDFDADFDDKVPLTLWTISYFNPSVARGLCKDQSDIETLMYAFLADATHQIAPYRISTPQNPITPPLTKDIDSLLANCVLTPIFFPSVYATGIYALADLSHGQEELWGIAYNGTIYWRSSKFQCLRMIPFEQSFQLSIQGVMVG
jgi:hypothetical protein